MAYERDPLSARYDAAAGDLLGRAYAKPGTWVYSGIPVSDGEQLDDGGLTAHCRAFQRSLFWCHNGGGNGSRNARWSLQRDWGPVTSVGGQRVRLVSVRVSDLAAARKAVNRKPRTEQWWRSPDLRSGGLGSTQQRFP